MGMAAEAHQFHVLAVDDSIIDRKLIERLLKTSSYQVTAVDSGSKALEFLGLVEEEEADEMSPPVSPASYGPQAVEVNLIITDYCMPGMTGYDLLRRIKESKSFKDIPVVIMSSENVPSRINRCLEEGAEEFFLKPVQLSDVSKLRPHLMKGRSIEEEEETDDDDDDDDDDDEEVNSNKRKAMEGFLTFEDMEEEITNSPERTRTRYNGDLQLQTIL